MISISLCSRVAMLLYNLRGSYVDVEKCSPARDVIIKRNKAVLVTRQQSDDVNHVDALAAMTS